MAIVVVENERYTVDKLYQWDINQVLEIRGLSLASTPEIHFTNSGMDKAIVRQATKDAAGVITVDIPNSLLQKPSRVIAYVCVYEGDSFETKYKIEIPLVARVKPNDYTIEDSDEEIYSFNALESKVENLAAQYAQTDEALNNKYELAASELAKQYESTDLSLTKNYNKLDQDLSAKYSALNNEVTNITNEFTNKLELFKTFITPQMLGAKTDGSTDSTSIFKKLVSEYNHILIENGTFIVSDSLVVNSNTSIYIRNAKIINTSTTNKVYIFDITGKSNVTIIGENATLEMSKPATAQQACINIGDAQNIVITGLTLSKAGGDGILVGGSTTTETANVEISNCIIDNNRRNGISLIGGIDGLTIRDCLITNTSGTNPQLAIDVETWAAELFNKNINIYNCTTKGNGNGSLTIFENSQNINVHNNTFYETMGIKANDDYVGLIENCPTNINVHNNTFNGVLYIYCAVYGAFTIHSNIFNGTHITIEHSQNITTLELAKNLAPKSIVNNIFNNCGVAMYISSCSNLIIDNNMINNCTMAFNLVQIANSTVRNNIINGYNVNNDQTDVVSLNGFICNNVIENNTFIQSNDNSVTNLFNFRGGNTSQNMIKNNNALNAAYTNFIRFDAMSNNIVINNVTPDVYNYSYNTLPTPTKKLVGTIVTKHDSGTNTYTTYICVGINGSYYWRKLSYADS